MFNFVKNVFTVFKRNIFRYNFEQIFNNDYFKNLKILVQQNIDFHIYQIKQENPLKVVVKHLHHSTNIKYIQDELKLLR